MLHTDEGVKHNHHHRRYHQHSDHEYSDQHSNHGYDLILELWESSIASPGEVWELRLFVSIIIIEEEDGDDDHHYHCEEEEEDDDDGYDIDDKMDCRNDDISRRLGWGVFLFAWSLKFNVIWSPKWSLRFHFIYEIESIMAYMIIIMIIKIQCHMIIIILMTSCQWLACLLVVVDNLATVRSVSILVTTMRTRIIMIVKKNYNNFRPLL